MNKKHIMSDVSATNTKNTENACVYVENGTARKEKEQICKLKFHRTPMSLSATNQALVFKRVVHAT